MTCICALVKDGEVWMAGDLMGSNGHTGKVYPDSKVFINGEIIFGYTSSFRMGQILQYNWIQPPRLEGLSDREYLQLDIVESIRSCFSSFGYGIKDGVEDMGGNFLIGYRGCIYEMQDNFSILQNLDYVAIGSGSSHAEAVLATLIDGSEDYDPQEVLEKSIYVASKFVRSVSAECTILTTDQGEGDDEGIINLCIDDVETTQDILILKTAADSLDIKFPHNIKLETLRSKILKFLED